MPKIFTIIDTRMKTFYSGKRCETISDKLPPGVVEHGERWVESQPIQLAGHASKCYVKGKFDTVVKFDDGSYGVVDFKTSERKEEHIPLYSRQLHAYAHALENPAPGKFSLKPVSKLGLLIFEPQKYAQSPTSGLVGFAGSVVWREIKKDDSNFNRFLHEIMNVLELPNPPDPDENCEWCRYRNDSKKKGL